MVVIQLQVKNNSINKWLKRTSFQLGALENYSSRRLATKPLYELIN